MHNMHTTLWIYKYLTNFEYNVILQRDNIKTFTFILKTGQKLGQIHW